MADPWEKYKAPAPAAATEDAKPWEKFATPQGQDAGAGYAFGEGLAGAVPFGNVITSGMAALGTAALSPDVGFKDIPELYNEAQANTKATAEAHPGASLAGNLTGVAASLPAFASKAIIGQIPTQGVRGAINAIPKAAAITRDFVRGGEIAKDASLLSKTGQLGVRSLKGAAVAAPTGALYGAGNADAGDRLHGAATGAASMAALGAAGPLAAAGGSAALNAVAPKINEGLRDVAALAQKYKIPVSLDQISSSRALKNVQKVSQELPFSGQEGFRDKQMSAFNRALLNTVGVDADKITKMNMDKAFINVGKEFDDLGKGKTFQLDDAFSRRLDDVRQEAQSISTKDAVSNFENEVANILKEAGPTGSISGEKLGTLRARVNRLARKSNNPDTQDLLHDLENAIVDTMTAGDDAVSGAFSKTKQKYKNLLVLEPLAAKAKAGNISPSLLNNRVSKIYGRSHTTGNAGEIGDLAQIGHELLPELGGSDTTQKLLYATGSTGAAIANPAATATGLGANRLFQEGINRNQKLIGKMLTPKEISKLPPKEAAKLVNEMRNNK